MRLIRIVACVALMMIVPATARATWWDWIQEMSGPGPFVSRGPVLATVCSKDLSRLIANDRPVENNWGVDKPCWFVDLRRFASDDNRKNFPAPVDLTAFDAGLTLQLLPYRFVEIGAGLGVAHFSGANDVTANRFTVTIPRVVITPLALLSPLSSKHKFVKNFVRVLKLHAGYIWIPGSVQAEDFGVNRGTGPGQSTFGPVTGEFLPTHGILIDFGELLRR